MKENFTSINVVIDKSGSMSHLTADTIGGFNTFLADQKADSGTAALTLCLFNDNCDMVHVFKDLNEVEPLNEKTYRTSGYTALLDALGTVINDTGKKLSDMPEEERPSKVIVLVITDGQENCSREYSKEKIKEMIAHQEEKYNWSFVFMGANIDAVTEGAAIGISAQNSIQYSASAAGTGSLYANVSKGVRRARFEGSAMRSNQRFFTAEEVASINHDVPDAPVVPNIIAGTVDSTPEVK